MENSDLEKAQEIKSKIDNVKWFLDIIENCETSHSVLMRGWYRARRNILK